MIDDNGSPEAGGMDEIDLSELSAPVPDDIPETPADDAQGDQQDPPGDNIEEFDINTLYQPDERVNYDPEKLNVFSERFKPRYGALTLPSQGLEELDRLLEAYNIDSESILADLSEKEIEALPRETRELRDRLRDRLMALFFASQRNYGKDAMNREDSVWSQGINHDGHALRLMRSKLSSNANPVLRINQQLGLSGLYQFPLWHTGIWLSVSTPSEARILELERRLAVDKVSLGRESSGRIFSAHEIYTQELLVDFILEHVQESTAPKSDRDYLRKIIRIADIPLMIHGIATALYPDGYPYRQPCMAKPRECTHTVEQTVALSKLVWVDGAMLSERQKKHMSLRTTRTTAEALETYQNEFVWKADGHLDLGSNVKLRFRVPTLEQFQDSGYRWINEIREGTNKAFGIKLQGDAREDYMRQMARFETVRQYGHYFDAVISTITDTEEVINDAEQLDGVVKMMCGDIDLVENISKHIHKFIDGSTVAVIAVPKEPCPACGATPPEEYLRHPRLIPLDVALVFFTLSAQRISRNLRMQDPL